MKKPELDSILKQARLPEISEESLALFPRRLVARLKRNEPPRRAARFFFPRLAWAFAVTLCGILAFVVIHRSGRTEMKSAPESDSLANAKLIRETMELFPNRVRAIVQDERGLNLVLSENEDVAASTPIYVRICDGKQCASFVTFSGQEIQAAGRKVTVLADARGGIILTGNQFVWSNTERTYAGKRFKKDLNDTKKFDILAGKTVVSYFFDGASCADVAPLTGCKEL